MPDKPLSGFHAALPTPFADGGARLDEPALGELVEHVLASGADGLYVGGSTAEAFLMDAAERRRVLEVCAEAAAGRTVLIAHVGDIDPRLSGALIDTAVRAGFDAVSAVPPFYYGFSFEEIRAHYERLASASDLPFLVYHFPTLSGVRFDTEQLVTLLALPNVVGVKNTCGDHHALERLRAAVPEKTLLNGFDETLLSGLALGADGGIGSTYNVQMRRVQALAAALARGAMDEARRLQAEMNGLIDAMIAHGVLPSLKYLLNRQGLVLGECRAPFAPLDAAARRALDAAAERYLST